MPPAELLQFALWLLFIQGLLGGFDTLYHHEFTVALPQQSSARIELMIHAIRAMLYAIVFLGIAHLEFHGAWVWSIIVVVIVEVWLTLWDFVVEDRSRKLPASERVTHTLLAINGGALFGLYGWQLFTWYSKPNGLLWRTHGWLTWALTVLGFGVLLSGIRDLLATRALSHPRTDPLAARGDPSLSILVTGATGFIGSALVRQLITFRRKNDVLEFASPARGRDSRSGLATASV